MSVREATRMEAARLCEEAARRRAEGNLPGAAAHFHRAARQAADLGEPGWQAAILCDLAALYQEAAAAEEAARHYEAALALYRALSDRREFARVLCRLSEVALLAGDPDAAERAYRASLKSLSPGEDPETEATARIGLGNLLVETGRPESGIPELARGLALLWKRDETEAREAARRFRHWRASQLPSRVRAHLDALGGPAEVRALLLE